MLATTVSLPGSSWVASAALLITAVVGAFAFQLSKRAESTKESVGGANTAIRGLEVLADQHAKEIQRLDKRHEECQKENASLRGQMAHMSGQIDVLTALTAGAAHAAVTTAAIAAAAAVDVAAKAAAAAVDTAAQEVKTERRGVRAGQSSRRSTPGEMTVTMEGVVSPPAED